MKVEQLTIATDTGPLTCVLAEPQAGVGAGQDAALLFSFVSTRQAALDKSPYVLAANVFLETGNRVLSFGLPNHGERVDSHGEGIRGMCAALLAGADPFERFVADGRAAVDYCLERGLVSPGRIAVSGVSRSGYCALRLAAVEPRIAAVAGLAPVTDWRVLAEFSEVGQRPEVAALALDHWAAPLAGRPVFLAIGNADARVGTVSCLRFAGQIAAGEAAGGVTRSGLEVHVVEADGHSLAESWYAAGARFLLGRVT